MAPTRTWTLSWDNAPTDQTTIQAQVREILYQHKVNMLTAAFGSWSVLHSSDGASNAGAADYWDGVTKLVWNTNGSSHSYITLYKTDYPTSGNIIYCTISLSTGSSNQHLINVTYSAAAPTLDGSPLINDPTFPASKYRTFSNVQVVRTPVANVKYHSHGNTTGDWALFVSVDGAGRFPFAMGMLKSTNFMTGDKWPCLCFSDWLDSGQGSFTHTNMQSTTAHVMFQHSNDNPYPNYSGISRSVFVTAFGDSLLAYIDSNGSDISGEMPAVPVVLFGHSAGNIDVKGALVDIFSAPFDVSVAQGSTVRPIGTAQYAVVGQFWFPCGGTVPTL